MRILKLLWLLLLLLLPPAIRTYAGELQTIDLKPFVGPSPFLNINADYLLPRGRQVIDGTPFQIDGVIFIKGGSAAKKAGTNAPIIPVGKSFEKLHLLVSGQTKSPEKTPICKIHLIYTDGNTNTLVLRFGDHIRNWYGPWHKAEASLGDPNSRVAWIGQFSAAATTDNYLRLFHVILDNPSPDKEVRSITLESTGKPTSMMFVAMSVGSSDVERLADTVPLPKSPFPDLRPRKGDLVRGGGVIKTRDGTPIDGAHVIVTGARDFDEGYSPGHMEDSAISQEAMTDANGKFMLPPLPDNRFYSLVAVAEGFNSAPYGGMDAKSDPIEIRLTSSTNAASKAKFSARAKVVDIDGKPVSLAIVEPSGVADSNGSYWGSGEGFPEQLLTDKDGEVVLSRKDSFERVQITVHAPNLAPAKVWLEATNQTEETIEMGAGSTIQGRVLKDGQPLAGIRIGVSGVERDMMSFAGSFYSKTDTNGVFTLAHLPKNTKWWLYGTMSSLKSQGAIQQTMVETGSNGSSNNVGDLLVIKGITLSGTVKTLHGEPLPKGVRIGLSYDSFSDYQSVEADSKGQFKFEGLHKGSVAMNLSTQGWKFAGNMRSEDAWNSWRLVGMIEKDKDDMLLIIQKGNIEYYSGSSNGQLPSQDWPQNLPIAGAERSAGPPPIILAGSVVDDKTGQAISVYKITPGRKPPVTSTGTTVPKPILQQVLEPLKPKIIPWNERIYWQYNRKDSFTNCNFAMEFFPLTSTPILKVEAEGYEPIETAPISSTTSNLVIRLKKGAGPNGIVLLPDGKPASGATILYAVLQQQFGLSDTTISSYGERQQGFVKTKDDGKFSFPRLSQGQKLFVAHSSGYTEESVEHGGDNLKLRLKPWAALTGTLVYSNGTPAANIPLNLSTDYNWQRGDPIMHINQKTTTDAQGNFLFTNVPPRHIRVDRMLMTGRGGWSSIPQTWLEVSPGITNNLGKVTYDTPPPPPMIDQLKQKLGL